jgi:syntaxin 16
LKNNNKIDELVKNINKLSVIYKELNSLVIVQGSLIDRIDMNIETTLTHTKSAVVHLEAADEHASNPFASKVIKILVVMIMVLAILLGLKWMA